MSDDDTEFRPILAQRLPVALEPRPSPSLRGRSTAAAAFVSQLLAERNHLAVQRARRRGTVGDAVHAYSEGASASRLRMPQGYRRTIVA